MSKAQPKDMGWRLELYARSGKKNPTPTQNRRIKHKSNKAYFKPPSLIPVVTPMKIGMEKESDEA